MFIAYAGWQRKPQFRATCALTRYLLVQNGGRELAEEPRRELDVVDRDALIGRVYQRLLFAKKPLEAPTS